MIARILSHMLYIEAVWCKSKCVTFCTCYQSLWKVGIILLFYSVLFVPILTIEKYHRCIFEDHNATHYTVKLSTLAVYTSSLKEREIVKLYSCKSYSFSKFKRPFEVVLIYLLPVQEALELFLWKVTFILLLRNYSKKFLFHFCYCIILCFQLCLWVF